MAVVVITGAGSGIGRLTAHALAEAGHTVYAGMRGLGTRNAQRVDEIRAVASERKLDLRPLELDVLDPASSQAAAASVHAEHGGVDVLVHNAAHLYFGISEAFTPEQVARSFDTNVIGALRVNRAFLPAMRARRSGYLIWVGSGSSRVVPPFLGAYTAAKAAFDSFAETIAYETVRFGIDTTIVMPGIFVEGTEHFPNAEFPEDADVQAEYSAEYDSHLARNEEASRGMTLPGEEPAVQAVADEIVRAVALPPHRRPFRTTVDFTGVGDIPVNVVAAHVKTSFMQRFGMVDLLPGGPAVVDGRRPDRGDLAAT